VRGLRGSGSCTLERTTNRSERPPLLDFVGPRSRRQLRHRPGRGDVFRPLHMISLRLRDTGRLLAYSHTANRRPGRRGRRGTAAPPHARARPRCANRALKWSAVFSTFCWFFDPSGLPGRGLRVQVWAEVPKPSPDAGRGESGGFARLLPGAAEIGCGFAGEADLGVGGDHEPCPPVRCFGSSSCRSHCSTSARRSRMVSRPRAGRLRWAEVPLSGFPFGRRTGVPRPGRRCTRCHTHGVTF
jgi:hypothetical protein